MNHYNEKEQVDEGLKDYVSMALIAGLLAVPGAVEAKDIYDRVSNKPSSEQLQTDLKNVGETEKLLGGYTPLQVGNILVRTLYAEAKGESSEGRKMVATVIWNRAGGNPEKFVEVCFAKSQFSCWNDYAKKSPKKYEIKVPKSIENSPDAKTIWKDCQKIVSDMMAKNFKPLGSWNSYLNPNTASKSAVNGWGKTMANQKKVGNHTFGYLENNDGFNARATKPQYPKTYTVKKSDKGVSYIAKNLIDQRKTPITDQGKLIAKIIFLNKLGPKATIKPNQVLSLPLKESFEIV